MKKLNKLFAILIAVLGVQTLSAQTDVTSTYLTNAGFDDESGWITDNIGQATAHAATNWVATSSGDTWWYGGAVGYGSSLTVNSVTAPATNPEGAAEGGALGLSAGWGCTMRYTQEVTLLAGVYTLSYKAYNANTSATQANNYIGFTSSSVTAYGKTTNFTANTWVEESVNFVLTTTTTGSISVGMGAISDGSGANAKLFVDGVTLTYKPFTDVTEANPVDLTSMASGNWILANGNTARTTGTDACGGLAGVSEAYQWGNCLAVADNVLTKSLSNLPSGLYTLEIYCASSTTSSRDNANYKVTDGDEQYVTLTANDASVAIPTYNRTSVGSVPVLTFNDVKVTDGNLKLAVNIKKASPNWLMAKVKSINFIGPDKSLEETTFNNNVTALKALSTADLPAAFVTKINNLITTYGNANASAMTLSELVAANGEIKAVTEAHSGVTVAFGNLTSFIELCTEYTSTQNSNANSDEVLSAFQTAISNATTAGDNATSADAINTAYNNLESARQIYAKNAVPVYPYAFDMTFLLTNPNFDSNIDGWTPTGGAGRMGAGNIECYNNTFTFALADKLTGLGNGTWEVSVDGFYRYGEYNEAEAAHNGSTEDLKVKFYANANEVALKSIMEGADKAGSVGALTTGGVRVPNSPADGNSYFPTGCYSNTVSTLVTDGTLTFGLKKESTQSNDWTLFDNFRLVYKGVDVSELQSSLSALITTADGIKDTKMGSTEKTNLDNAINDANASATDADKLNEMLSSLQGAYDAAVASIDTYSKVPAYITKANKIDESIAASIQTQYNEGTLEGNAETIFQNLEVATYNYVMSNFTYPVALSDTWNSTGTNTQAATFSNEHWSGETREYKNQDDSNGQGWAASSWTIDFDQEVTLPAGEYVFKVAGRKSEGTTLELVVTMGATVLGTVNDFPATNHALGINKTGATSFDPEDEAGFARNGEGFGWQWRYVRFVLNSESTVKVAVHAEANEVHQWVSFGDYTLQMTEDTYLEANKGGLDAPTAAAQALVNAVPMGTEEIAALNTALNLPVTTGQQLLDKIEALNTAVANANAWVPKYNEAKAPLVAALDRFEADYNDAQNGALNHMNKDRWATAISMAQAAAEAKDVTNSYADFETATNNLIAALDAATNSVNEYAALDAAIKSASSLYLGDNWGDQPFQRPISAKESLNTTTAQATYDAAEADGEDVTSVTAALNENVEAVDAIVLNAPTEGQRYYIKVATEGHGKKDNAWLVTLGATGDNNPTGYGLNTDNAAKGYLAQAFIFTQVEGNLYNISIERAEGTVYLTYGALNGSAAGWKNQQIQATTDAEKKGEFKIVPTGNNGILKIFNTIDNNYLDCQDGGSIYTDTGIENEEFAFELATETEVTLTLSKEGWATLILPFNAELPEGVKAYSCTEADGETLNLVEEVESLKANTPYLMSGNEGTYNFSGYGLADKDSYTDGLFTGTYVNYETTNDGKTYVLQNHDGDVAFYLVGESQPIVNANHCYMTYEEVGAQTQVFRLVRGGTTSIDNMESTGNGQQAVVIYDLMGRKVSTMEKGKMYIVNGVKVLIK